MTDPPDLAIDPASRDDLDELLALAREFYAGERLSYDATLLRRLLGEMREDPRHGATWLARAGGEAVGYAVLCCGYSLEHGGRDAFVDELFVRPGWRGRGIGGRLLDALEAECRARGIGALHLEVDRDNAAARRLYLQRGFSDQGRHLVTRRLDR